MKNFKNKPLIFKRKIKQQKSNESFYLLTETDLNKTTFWYKQMIISAISFISFKNNFSFLIIMTIQ